jgi:hypothetical protein
VLRASVSWESLVERHVERMKQRLSTTHPNARTLAIDGWNPLRAIRITKRLFVEGCHRFKIIPNAFGERGVLKLMFGELASVPMPSTSSLTKMPS